MKKQQLAQILFLFLVIVSVNAQDILGKWKTVDDETGKTKSIVQLYEKNEKVYGKILKLLLSEDKGKLCNKCKEPDYNQPIEGMVIVKELSQKNNYYEGGTIFDPKKGKEYKCKMWIDKNDIDKLNVRGYIAFFYRTQNWFRVKD